MAFSQKHTGKVFVPWFNTAEWQCVFNFVTSNHEEERKRALDILRIWKLRTPLLSAGIEGTLILLETLLTDKNDLSEHQIVQIYSVTLLRFLNICAANSDKQGTFNKTVSKNDLPRWLIDIRHDIAHSNKLPSIPMLELALTQSFEWVIEKYWKIQYDTISDYFASTDGDDTKLVDTLNAYIGLSFNIHMNVDMKEYEDALMKKVNYLVSKRYNKPKTDKQGLLDILEEILKQSLSCTENTNISNKVAEVLTSVSGLLDTHLETNSEGVAVIPEKFRLAWTRLLNILLENECLTTLLERLFSFAGETVNESTNKRVAIAWLHHILDGLLKLHFVKNRLERLFENAANENNMDLRTNRIVIRGISEKKMEFPNCIDFESFEKLPLKDLSTLENSIINGPVRFGFLELLEKVMILNNRPRCEIDAFSCLIKSTETSKHSLNSDTSLTIQDISMDEDVLQVLEFKEKTNNSLSDSRNEDEHIQDEIILGGMNWEIERDPSIFKDYPLGILPNQNRTSNPLITFQRL